MILSVRKDADTWFARTQRIIFNPATLAAAMSEDVKEMIETSILSMFGGNVNDPEHCKAVYEPIMQLLSKLSRRNACWCISQVPAGSRCAGFWIALRPTIHPQGPMMGRSFRIL